MCVFVCVRDESEIHMTNQTGETPGDVARLAHQNLHPQSEMMGITNSDYPC